MPEKNFLWSFDGKKFSRCQSEYLPSDYFGDDFELDLSALERLRSFSGLSQKKFAALKENFSKDFFRQKSLRNNKTNLNFYFCDYVLHERNIGEVPLNYFSFEFYKKSFDVRNSFTIRQNLFDWSYIVNKVYAHSIANNKARANKYFADFINKDWLDTTNCDFEDFKNFTAKHPRFFAKFVLGIHGTGSKIIQLDDNSDLEKIFADLKSKRTLLEQLIIQHDAIAEFYPNSVNTVRLDTILDVHNIVNVVSACGRFGRGNMVVDNYSSGGFAVSIDPKTGVIISEAVDHFGERAEKHPDTGKVFKGFQYPCWDKILSAVKKMARLIPDMRYIGWDFSVNNEEKVVLIEMNGIPGENIQQAPDGIGKRAKYERIINEIKDYNKAEMDLLGWRVNRLDNFDKSYNTASRSEARIKFALENLIAGCEGLVDLGCRQSKLAKKFCPADVKYFPVDYKKHDDETISCDFNLGDFPNVKADTVLCAFTAEYVEPLKNFLENMSNAAQKQILMICRPVDKEIHTAYRWKNPFLTDFTEKFLIEMLEKNNFKLYSQKPMPENNCVILYDFRKC